MCRCFAGAHAESEADEPRFQFVELDSAYFLLLKKKKKKNHPSPLFPF